MMDLSDFKSFQDRVTSSLLTVTRTAGQISAEDLSFYRSSNVSLSRSLDTQNAHLLQLTHKLLKAATTATNVDLPRVNNAEDLDDNWRGLVDVVDHLLERADACLDEYTGVIKRLSPTVQEGGTIPTAARDSRSKKFPSTFSARQLAKPQLLFEKAHTNHETAPFKPLLRSKPHAIVDLEESIGPGGANGYQHPYTAEIEQLSYPHAVHTATTPMTFTTPGDKPAIFVDTKDGVAAMLAELREASEIAIDLEHHDAHSYVGIVCLMQISTRQKDWIIDTLVPWREDLQILNEVFTDPKVLKVLQGSTMDMIWLQRDLGLYIVGLFDTFHASSALGFPQRSLKYLLERFCGFQANKKHQMADWRIRPIPQEMLDYARSDTHYLLFIYDSLRNMLLEASSSDNNLITYVLEESKREALQRYERAVYNTEKGLGSIGWFTPLARRSVRFTPEQFAVYRAVHEWRDRTARALDEGVMSVMTQATLFAVAEAMPVSVPALMSVTNPVSKAIKEFSRDLVDIVKKGKDAGRQGPTVADVMRENEAYLPLKRNPRKATEHERQDPGGGAILQMLNENGGMGGDAERNHHSRLWGPIAKSFSTAASQLAKPLNDAIRLILPLPEIDTKSFATAAQSPYVQQTVDASTLPPDVKQSANDDKSTGVFILKDIGRLSKRKLSHASADGEDDNSSPTNRQDTNTGFSPAANTDTRLAAEKAEAGARRREEKQRKKALGEDRADVDVDVPMKPFDYANAESVLQAKPDGHDRNGKGAADVRGPFNPYIKSTDGPQGLKRARKEASGKSFTFKK